MRLNIPTLSAAVPRRQFNLSAEFFLVLGLVAVIFVINLATLEIYPMVWVDETGYVDPGINLALGNGLTSSAAPNVVWGKFWFAFPPLYPLLLAPWVTWLGISLITVRLLGVAFISGGAIALWHYTIRSGLFPSMLGRITVVLLPLLGYGVSFAYRSARPDALCALLAALALDASLIPNPRWRATALISIGGLVPWAGPQLAAFAVILSGLIGIWWPRPMVRVFLPLASGMGLGLIALLGLYVAEGSLYGFLASMFGSFNTITGQVAQLALFHDPRSVTRFSQLPSRLLDVVFADRSSAFLSAAAILLCISVRRATDAAAFKLAGFAVTASFGIPILMEFAGQYHLVYTWMSLVTVGIAVVASLEASTPSPESLTARRLATGYIGLALLLGLPLQLTNAYLNRGARDYDALRAFIRTRVSPGDWVYVARQAYYAVVERGGIPVTNEYATGRLVQRIPDDQRERIKLFIAHPDPITDPNAIARLDRLGLWSLGHPEIKPAIERLGGSWEPCGAAFSPPRATGLIWGENENLYQLVAYCRE
jgi:hypothetical protein